MKKCYATIHVRLHDMDHNINLNYHRKIRPMKGCKLDKGKHGLLCKDCCKMNGPKVSAELIHTAGFGSGGLTLVKPFDTSRQVLS